MRSASETAVKSTRRDWARPAISASAVSAISAQLPCGNRARVAGARVDARPDRCNALLLTESRADAGRSQHLDRADRVLDHSAGDELPDRKRSRIQLMLTATFWSERHLCDLTPEDALSLSTGRSMMEKEVMVVAGMRFRYSRCFLYLLARHQAADVPLVISARRSSM
jgi:hypothetical protein